MNFSENEIVTLDIAIRKVENGVFAVGASFQHRHAEGGSYRYETFKVASLYIASQDMTSTNKCILYVLKQLLNEIPEDTKLVRIRSDMPHFHRGMKLKKILEPIFNKKEVEYMEKNDDMKVVVNEETVNVFYGNYYEQTQEKLLYYVDGTFEFKPLSTGEEEDEDN